MIGNSPAEFLGLAWILEPIPLEMVEAAVVNRLFRTIGRICQR